ncbi:hypothetical protein [Anaeromyxobacter sp. Fw109-5]|uniref:hypothetical protein n=1 Tax=Anaeromyxobacter sp. (strain Fw109-5) TaxID=404589 RepID=UPI0002F77402|nr:hypothetical protein [Anaeromyxobacter sp. Fw109-5]
MHVRIHALAALLLASLTSTAAAGHPARPVERPARHGPYFVELTDELGNVLPTWTHRGRTYVLGALGERYLVRVRNQTGRRAEVVVSVDGRDVIDGRPASWAKRGYLLEAGGEAAIDGFRLSDAAVAAFRFSSVPRSYAALKGDARDVGVIGVAVFPEREPARLAPPRRVAPSPEEGRAGAPDEKHRSSPSAPGEARAEAAPRPQDRSGLGTEFGEEHASHVRTVHFERASARPAAVLTLLYDDRRGLLALGIDVDGRWAARDDAWLRETAEPFRESRGFAEPPPGWRPR